MKKILCFGANSDIAKSLLRRLAEFETSEFILVSRDIETLSRLQRELTTLGSKKTEVYQFDADKISHESIFENSSIDNLFNQIDCVDYVIVAHGYLPSRPLYDPDEAHKTFCVNCLSYITIINKAVQIMKRQGYGKLVVITSVAGDRGRKKLGVYSSAKSAVESYLSAVRQDCAEHKNIQILTVKPGFVRTKMTANLNGPLPVEPEKVANDIFWAMLKNKQVIYTPWFWRYIMAAIKLIPEVVFKRLNF